VRTTQGKPKKFEDKRLLAPGTRRRGARGPLHLPREVDALARQGGNKLRRYKEFHESFASWTRVERIIATLPPLSVQKLAHR
jgi:hypothetical protein